MIIENKLQVLNLAILIVYIVFVLPYMNHVLLKYFSNMYVRLIILLIIILLGIQDSLLSILLAIAFVLTHVKYQHISNNTLSEEDRNMIKDELKEN